MQCFFEPYEGSEPFLFFSYCHEDAAEVFPMIERLVLEGYRVWYDSGVAAGEEWPEVVAGHLASAAACVAAVSRRSVASHNCKNEMNFAVAHNVPMVAVVLGTFQMPLGIQLQLGSSFFLDQTAYPREQFYEKLLSAANLRACRLEGLTPTAEAIAAWSARAADYQAQQPVPTAQKPATDQWFEKRIAPSVPVQSEPEPPLTAEPEMPAPDDEDTIYEDPEDVTSFGEEQHAAAPFASLLRLSTMEWFALDRYEHRIGRSHAQSDIVIEGNNGVSRCHAEIIQYQGKYVAFDVGSKYGTTVDGVKLQQDDRVELGDFNRIGLADETFLFFSAAGMAALADSAAIRFLECEETGESKLLSEEPLLLDRHHPWRGGVLSDRHIRRQDNSCLFVRDGCAFLQDINSAHGTFLNGARLEKGQALPLKDGDRAGVYQNVFVYREIPMEKGANK